MVVISPLIINQNGKTNSRKTPVTSCTTMIRTMERLRVKNGILLTTNPAEHTGWIIVDAGRMMRAQISAVTIARAVMPLEKRMKTSVNAAMLSSCSNKSPVKKYTLPKRAPGSMICAKMKKDPT